MPFLLSLETSGTTCSVALHDGDRLLHAEEVLIPQSHASKVAVLVESVLKKSGITPEQLAAIAISSGPGSYTGLRIGTSLAKGLCYALSIPLIAIPTLDLLTFHAAQLHEMEGFLCPMIDARRMEVYCQVTDSRQNVIQPVSAVVVEGQSFAGILDHGKMFFFGDGAAKCQSVLTHPNAVFVSDILPAAQYMGAMANRRLENGKVEDVIHFEPFYLKDFVAKKSSAVL